MGKLKLFLILILMYLATVGKAQVKENSSRGFYRYSWIWVREANKSNGEKCYVILESSGLGNKQKPSIMKTSDGKSIVFDNMIDALNYLEQQGWEIFLEFQNSITNLLVRHKVTKEELDKAVKEHTHYEVTTPKIELNMLEKQIKADYE